MRYLLIILLFSCNKAISVNESGNATSELIIEGGPAGSWGHRLIIDTNGLNIPYDLWINRNRDSSINPLAVDTSYAEISRYLKGSKLGVGVCDEQGWCGYVSDWNHKLSCWEDASQAEFSKINKPY